MKTLWMVLLAALAISRVALATESSEDSLKILLHQQRLLQTELDRGVDGITARGVTMIRKAQKEVFAVTEGKNTLDELNIDEMVRLENALERINAEVMGTRVARDAQQVCWREAKSGSSIKVTRCGTQAERDQVREGARAWMEKPKICIPPGCGESP